MVRPPRDGSAPLVLCGEGVLHCGQHSAEYVAVIKYGIFEPATVFRPGRWNAASIAAFLLTAVLVADKP
jgi:hypothetical protein